MYLEIAGGLLPSSMLTELGVATTFDMHCKEVLA